jgi:hypothetical protein
VLSSSSINILWKSVFENLSKWWHNPRWRIFDFLLSKNWQKSTDKDFFVLKFCRKAFLKIFQNGGAIQDGGF